MNKPTAKQLALKINPDLFTERDNAKNTIVRDKENIYATAFYPQQAWHDAYHQLAADQFKVGDLLVMVNCYEAKVYQNRVWLCRHNSYQAASGDYWVFLQGFSGAFVCEYLRKATDEEIQAYLQAELSPRDSAENKASIEKAYQQVA